MKALIAALTIAISHGDEPKQWPSAPFENVVGYCYDFTKDSRGSAITFQDGSIHKGVIKATTIRLIDKQTKQLIAVLNKNVEYERGDVDCYDPHHAFVFYDEHWKVVASIDICFMCDDFASRPTVVSDLIDLRAMEKFCRDVGLPLHEDPVSYTKLYEQEQSSTSSDVEPDRPAEVDPFAPAE